MVFGVGKGIRHRGGLGAAIGLDVPCAEGDELSWYGSGEVWFDWFFASEAPGPAWYAGGAVAIGLDHRLF